jgi:hypothetical protein
MRQSCRPKISRGAAVSLNATLYLVLQILQRLHRIGIFLGDRSFGYRRNQALDTTVRCYYLAVDRGKIPVVRRGRVGGPKGDSEES